MLIGLLTETSLPSAVMDLRFISTPNFRKYQILRTHIPVACCPPPAPDFQLLFSYLVGYGWS